MQRLLVSTNIPAVASFAGQAIGELSLKLRYRSESDVQAPAEHDPPFQPEQSEQPDRPRRHYLVATGIRIYPIWALNPRHAIETLKGEILRRRSHYSANAPVPDDSSEPVCDRLRGLDIGLSLVEALEGGRLNFLVFNADHRAILAGELRGQYQEEEAGLRELARIMPERVSPMHLYLLSAYT